MINIKKNTLEKLISSEINELLESHSCDTAEFAIANIEGFQVVVKITKDDWEMCNEVWSEYLEGDD